jgi:maltose O-acetyltransferase
LRSGFLYLWRHRERPVEPRRRLKVWLKRLYHLKSTLMLLLKPALLRRRGARIGDLVIVGQARISGKWSGLAIGDESSLGRCEISLHDRVTIGSRVAINDGAIILTASHALGDPGWATTRAPVVIGDYAWIATGAIILPGVSIGRGAVIGAGAVVRGDVPAYAVAIGNPAQILPRRRVEELDYSPVLLNAPFEAWTGPRRRDSCAGST